MRTSDRAALELIAGAEPIRAKELGSAWQRHMRRGEFEAAWRVSDKVMHVRGTGPCHHLPRHFQWIWDGTPLQGKHVLIRCYHGLGDTIQFIRFAIMVKAIARKVTVWAQPELLPLLATMKGGFDDLLPLHDGAPQCTYDVDLELMELPHIFRTTLASVPAKVPYLHVAPARLPQNGRPNVGLVWEAGEWDDRRSIPFERIERLACSARVNWIILQRGPALAKWDRAFGVDRGTDDILSTARVVAGLDLLLTIDSMPAHLGGALGVPTWTLLHADPDWRWLENRDNSPWYPTLRLFRQEKPGEWGPVLAKVTRALAPVA